MKKTRYYFIYLGRRDNATLLLHLQFDRRDTKIVHNRLEVDNSGRNAQGGYTRAV